MTTAYAVHDDYTERDAFRILAFYAVLLANVGSFGILFFWLTGAVSMLTDNGGQVLLLGLDGLALVLFWSLPVIVLISLGAWLLYLARLDLPAVALAGAPIALTVVYYLWLVMIRSV